MPSRYILQIETATQVCSVALSADGETIAFCDIDEPNVHAAQLTVSVEELLRASSLSFKDLAAVAVGKGPGSYTGLRIGVSTAKGLCYATDLPLIAIDTLAGMAAGFVADYTEPIAGNMRFCPMVDARRMEVYAAVYGHDLQPITPAAATIVDAQSFEYLGTGEQMVLFGSGADKLAELFADNKQVEVIPGFKNSARHLSRMADLAYQEKQFANLAYFEPYYLKDFVATAPKQRSPSL